MFAGQQAVETLNDPLATSSTMAFSEVERRKPTFNYS
jgi:hypothetical protein